MSKIVIDRTAVEEFINSRYIEAVFPSKDRVAEIMSSGKQLVFYWGIDPTGPDVHLGHTTNIFVMKKLIELGHKIIMLIGSFTAMIGDPTGKDTARKVLTNKEVKENMSTYINQVQKILPKGSFDVKYNSDWYKKMATEEFLKLTDHITVQQMIARDMFQKRIKEDKPISLREFMYPLLQGYDSVAMKVDGEVGGNDQTFNMMVGRDLAKVMLNKDKIVIATRLLEDPVTARKIMSKSEGQYISLNDSAMDMFGKTMALPDSAILTLFRYATELPENSIGEIKKRLDNGENPKNIKEELAFELVKMYHKEKEALKAKKDFDNVFSEGQTPENMPDIKSLGNILETAVSAGIVLSSSEMKRLVEQGAVRINNQVVERWDYEDKPGDVLKVGSHKFYKLK
ncbi:MAG TPA: tyrosine--tRNA ligase [Candidatus Paceibacterota bacterium]